MTSFEEFAEQLASLTDIDSIWRHTARLAYSFGFSACSLTVASRQPDGLESIYLRSDLSYAFHENYKSGGLIDCDPFLLFGCNSLVAKRIDGSNLSSFPGASIQHQMFLDHATAAGAANGFGVPVRPAGDDVFGGWLFSCSNRKDDFDRLIGDCGHEAHLAAVLAYERMTGLGMNRVERTKILSGRERECLLWLCAGLRVSMIADKLMISDSAVNLYITNAKRKLGARTREQAISIAIVRGEISL